MKAQTMIKGLSVATVVLISGGLTGCMMPIEGAHSEQQKRMLRCDQYIDEQRETCLRGEAVTIDDFKDDYKDYQKSKKQEAQKAKEQQQPIKVKKADEPESLPDSES